MLQLFSDFIYSNISLTIVGGLCLLNFIFAVFYFRKLKQLKKSSVKIQNEFNQHLLELAGDVKALYESGSTLGNKMKNLEYGAKMMKEEQEKLSLKEPSQQMYRNAVQQIHNGESVNKISETSGLSRGEVELLQLFQNIDAEVKKDKIAS